MRPIDELAHLLDRAAELAPDDAGWQTLSADAQRLMQRLAARGLLDPRLVASPDDAPVVIVRLLARAWLRLRGDLRWERQARQRWESGLMAVV